LFWAVAIPLPLLMILTELVIDSQGAMVLFSLLNTLKTTSPNLGNVRIHGTSSVFQGKAGAPRQCDTFTTAPIFAIDQPKLTGAPEFD
jgi:hypothetical protein